MNRAMVEWEARVERLTGREIDIVRLLAGGCSYGRAAEALGISPHTVNTHIKNTYRKLGVHCAAAAVMRALQLGLIADPLCSPDQGMGSARLAAYDESREGS